MISQIVTVKINLSWKVTEVNFGSERDRAKEERYGKAIQPLFSSTKLRKFLKHCWNSPVHNSYLP